MLESLRYIFNAAYCKNYATLFLSARDVNNRKVADSCLRKALKCGAKALELGPRAFMISPENVASVQRLVDGIRELGESGRIYRGFSSFPLRTDLAARSHSEAVVVHAADIYRTASLRLDSPPEIVRLIYGDNMVPVDLRDTMMEHAVGGLSREEAARRLEELRGRTERCLRRAGLDSPNPQRIDFKYFRLSDLEGNLDDGNC